LLTYRMKTILNKTIIAVLWVVS